MSDTPNDTKYNGPGQQDQAHANNNQDPYQRPEQAKRRPRSTMQEAEYIDIGGIQVPLSSTRFEPTKDGRGVRVTAHHAQNAADGTILPPDQIMGTSWTGHLIPAGRGGLCLSPYGLHPIHGVFPGIDGALTDKGNILCNMCLEYQEIRLKWIRRTLWLYRAETY